MNWVTINRRLAQAAIFSQYNLYGFALIILWCRYGIRLSTTVRRLVKPAFERSQGRILLGSLRKKCRLFPQSLLKLVADILAMQGCSSVCHSSTSTLFNATRAVAVFVRMMSTSENPHMSDIDSQKTKIEPCLAYWGRAITMGLKSKWYGVLNVVNVSKSGCDQFKLG